MKRTSTPSSERQDQDIWCPYFGNPALLGKDNNRLCYWEGGNSKAECTDCPAEAYPWSQGAAIHIYEKLRAAAPYLGTVPPYPNEPTYEEVLSCLLS